MKPSVQIDFHRKLLGRTSEDAAQAWFIRQTGARLVAQNFRCRSGEIDLIFELGPSLVFVEVRARLGDFQSGLESVDWKKRRKLSRAIRWFLVSYRGQATEIRIDVLQWNGKRWSHFPNQWIEP